MNQNNLLQEITAFCRLLKRMDVNVTTTNQISFCRSVELIDIGRRDDFYHAARTNLIANESDRAVFDVAFNLFWRHPRPELDTFELDTNELDEMSLQALSDTEDEQLEIEGWTKP